MSERPGGIALGVVGPKRSRDALTDGKLAWRRLDGDADEATLCSESSRTPPNSWCVIGISIGGFAEDKKCQK